MMKQNYIPVTRKEIRPFFVHVLLCCVSFIFQVLGFIFLLAFLLFWFGYLYGLQMIPKFYLDVPLDYAAAVAAFFSALSYLLFYIFKRIRTRF